MDNNLYPLVQKVLRLLILPVTVTSIFEIAALFAQNSSLLIWIGNIVLSLFVVKILYEKYPVSYNIGAWVGACSVGSVGFFLALAELIFYRRIWYVFLLISQPALFAFSGAFFCGGMLFILKKYRVQKDEPQKKSGKEVRP